KKPGKDQRAKLQVVRRITIVDTFRFSPMSYKITPKQIERSCVQIVSGVLSREHVHMFVEIPPHIAVSDFVRRVKGRSSHQVQMKFPLRKRCWGRHFWARGYFSTTSGNITDDVRYLQKHEPTGASR